MKNDILLSANGKRDCSNARSTHAELFAFEISLGVAQRASRAAPGGTARAAVPRLKL
jgi:hypothetical protein